MDLQLRVLYTVCQPVSYTHLDVYKRQMLTMTMTMMLMRFRSLWLVVDDGPVFLHQSWCTADDGDDDDIQVDQQTDIVTGYDTFLSLTINGHSVLV